MFSKANSAALLLLIAAGLLAGCTNSADTPTVNSTTSVGPAADGGESVAVVQRRDFQLSYQLDATTAASNAVVIPLPTGMKWAQAPEGGNPVLQGAIVGQAAVDPAYEAALAASAKSNRIDAGRLRSLGNAAGPVAAPITGILQVDSSGVVSIEAPGVDVTVPLTGIQDLRLRSLKYTAQATVETVAGRRAVPCIAVWTTPMAAEVGADAAEHLHCRLPQIVETAPELRAGLTITSEKIHDATVVPDAMLGYDDDGYTVTLRGDGHDDVTPVDVGPSDGVLRVITTDLPIGAQLVPPQANR